jgi:hypothetical protein
MNEGREIQFPATWEVRNQPTFFSKTLYTEWEYLLQFCYLFAPLWLKWTKKVLQDCPKIWGSYSSLFRPWTCSDCQNSTCNMLVYWSSSKWVKLEISRTKIDRLAASSLYMVFCSSEFSYGLLQNALAHLYNLSGTKDFFPPQTTYQRLLFFPYKGVSKIDVWWRYHDRNEAVRARQG